MSLNLTLFYALHSLVGRSEMLDIVLSFFASGFDYLVIVVTFLVVVFLYDPQPGKSYLSFAEIWSRLRELFFIVITSGVGWLVAKILKAVIATPRPFIRLPDVHPLFMYGGFDSFPSGHATLFAGLAVAFYIYNKKLGIVFAFFALVVGLARIVAGIHFPVDILAGYVLGGSISYFVYGFYKKIKKKATIDSWLKPLS